MVVDVFASDEQDDLPVELDRWVTLARAVLSSRGVKAPAEASLLFVDRDTIASLNDRYLGRSGPTDVLAFPIEDSLRPAGRAAGDGSARPGTREPAPGLLLLGDVVICPAVAAEDAADHGVDTTDELALLVVHGLLHLLGMDHQDDTEAEAMERVEQKLLARFHRPRSGARKD